MNNNNQTFQGNSGSNDVFTPSTRSSYKFFNSTSSLDKTMLTFTYWNSLLRITMNPIIVQDGSANKVDTNNRIDMYFSPSKAQMFLHCIQTFRKNPDAYKNIGVNTNKGIIFIANGEKMYGVKGTFIVINLINNENGQKEGEAAYQINSDVYAITDYAGGTDFTKNYDYSEEIELDMIEILLKNFISAYTNAVASSILEVNKYNDHRMFNFVKDVREKLGISNKESKSSKYNNSSWFNNNGNNTTVVSDSRPKVNTTDYEEVMNDIASLMD